MKKYAHGFYWPKTEQHFIEYLNLAGHSEYQLVPKQALDIVVTDWTCVIDIGAHVGTWSRWFAKRAASVHSFEPVKTNFACLTKNLEEYPNCVLYNNAISDEEKFITMWKPDTLHNTGQFSSTEMPGWKELRYKALCIDSLNLSPTVIKIDIQGGEYPALKGSEKTIIKNQPIICWENSNDNLDQDKIYKFLSDLGYRSIFQFKEDAIWVPSNYQLTEDQQTNLIRLFKENQKTRRPISTNY